MADIVDDERCPDCNGLYAMMGRRHNCRGAKPPPLVQYRNTAPGGLCRACETLQKRVIAQEADIKALKGALANAELALEAETKLRERETKIPETETKSLHSVSGETKLEVNKVSAILAAVNAAKP